METIASEDKKKLKNTAFLNLLHSEYQRRIEKNPQYSMRAYAAFLGIDQSLLSKILRGQRPLSEQLAFKISLALQIPEHDIRAFLESSRPKMSRYNRLSEDELQVISDWQPFALLELAQTVDFRPDLEWITKRLNTSVESIQLATSKLIYNRLIEIQPDGSWKILRDSNNWTESNYSSLARRKIQKQLLEKALAAIENVPISKRENLGMTIAINPAALPEIKRRIAEFSSELRDFINSYDSHQEVYQLTVGFFPLSQSEGEQK